MGGTLAKEAGVLKLVHPGRHVEIHRSPVLASQVMEKNPRHFVTRPDVFEFPWLVVRPESVLGLGCVFYIVPRRTLYRLLHKSRSVPPRIVPMMVGPTCSWAAETSTNPNVGQAKSCLRQSCWGSKSRDRHVMFRLSDRNDEERGHLLGGGGA